MIVFLSWTTLYDDQNILFSVHTRSIKLNMHSNEKYQYFISLNSVNQLMTQLFSIASLLK